MIVAHSERREYQKETDDQFVRKIDLIHQAGLKAIFCFGEVLDERKAGRAQDVVKAQLEGVLPRLELANAYNTVLAYEPVWAIGTGETATPEHRPGDARLFAPGGGRAAGRRKWPTTCASCTAAAASRATPRELIGLPDVDGGLIGGAALKPADFVGIIDGAEAAQG